MNPTHLLLRLASLAAVAAALWSAVAAKPTKQSYYPLTPGLVWEYDVSDGGGTSAKMRVSNGPEKQVGSWRATEQRMQMGNILGIRYVVAAPDKITMVAEQAPGQGEPTVLDPPSTILPAPVKVGDSWDSGVTQSAMAQGASVSTRATVESTTDDILVPAGPFSSCVRVLSQGQVSVQPADMEGSVQLVIGTRLWYAPGVGLVQMTRTESTDHADLGELQLTYKLTGR